VFTDPAGTPRALFVISDAERALIAIVLADASLRDAVTGETLQPANGRVHVPMSARGVRMFAIG
jgi:hypothetical protein